MWYDRRPWQHGLLEFAVFGKKSNLLGLALSLACLYLVFRKIDGARLWGALATLDGRFLVAAVAVFLTTFIVRTHRWQTLLAPAQLVPRTRLLNVVMIGYMANNVLPARLGEFVRAYVLSRQVGIRKSTTLATIFIERIFDGLSLLFILGALMVAHRLGFISLQHPFPDSIRWAGVGAGLVFLLAFGGVLALELVPGFGALLEGLIERLAPAGLQPRLRGILAAFVEGVACMRSVRTLAVVFTCSLAVWSIEGLTYALVGQAFHLELPLRAFFTTMVIVNLGTLIPSAPGFVGTVQLLCWISLSLFAVSKEAAVSFGLVLNVLEYLPVTLIGVACLALENLSLRAVVGGTREDGAPLASAAPAREGEPAQPLG
ncbi:MAG: lysylphosphatidylglycerol synthase transmembrane domain-containing protein [Candidatus Sericytochromatia bacterium]|nr:lysylphosphatidylglycerol synthase transmembrane domain-containing protein [Candidatus Sericytochromatia bacterium]